MSKIHKLILSSLVVSAMAMPAMAQAPDITGTYVNDTGRTKVRLSDCGAGVCGTVVWMSNPVNDVNNPDASKRDRPVVGIQAVTLKPTDAGTYTGSLYNTENGKTYSGKAKLSNKGIQLSGCVLGGLLCKDSTWRRVD